ncbi:protein ENDOSPERM DEFECTIVE 1-like isoform X2 [Panicum hallii]|uniref:protein ENDOSPERM DEFECTIVE 1-like isoform X2 n=1 Tax=Panicum hallii TaxID=206008 RepID=UPI000DF4EE42|nr:protein ENDOSPERM DEFECTIVE 1-like isoform X2 [Panicum hallii]
MAAASASTAPPPGETPAPASFAPGPPPPPRPDPLPPAARPRPRCRVREVSSRYLSAPLPAQARRLSTSSTHSASVPPPARGAQHHHRDAHAPAPAPFVFGLFDENRLPPTPGSRKRGAAPGLFDAMHRPRPGPEGLNPPARLAAGASRATATPSPRRILRPSKTSANVAAATLQDRRGCTRPSTPARASFSFCGASPEPSHVPAVAIDFCAPASCPRRAPCSEVGSSLQMTEGSRRPQNPFCFGALDAALSECKPTLPKAPVKPPQPPPARKAVVKKGAVIGGNKGVGKQEDVHQLRILENSCMQYRFLNARAEAVAMAKNAAAETSLYGLSVRMAGLQESVAEKKAELEFLKMVERVHSVVGAQWSELETEHYSCLGRGTAALCAASSCVPTIGNIRTSIGGINETLQSATKILEELPHSVEKLSGKAQEVEDVACLAEVVGSEQMLLEECADLLHQALNIQVTEDSLRIQLLHLRSQAKEKHEGHKPIIL